MPAKVFPEMTFRAAVDVPPIRLLPEPEVIRIPLVFLWATLPVESMPMKFPWMVLPPFVVRTMPPGSAALVKRLIMKPRMVELPAVI